MTDAERKAEEERIKRKQEKDARDYLIHKQISQKAAQIRTLKRYEKIMKAHKESGLYNGGNTDGTEGSSYPANLSSAGRSISIASGMLLPNSYMSSLQPLDLLMGEDSQSRSAVIRSTTPSGMSISLRNNPSPVLGSVSVIL
jgi:hypothetical protein